MKIKIIILSIIIAILASALVGFGIASKRSEKDETRVEQKIEPCDLKGRSIDLLVDEFNSEQDHYMKTTGILMGAPAPGWEQNLIKKIENRCIDDTLQIAQYSPINSIYIVNSTQPLDEQGQYGSLNLVVSNNRVIKAWF